MLIINLSSALDRMHHLVAPVSYIKYDFFFYPSILDTANINLTKYLGHFYVLHNFHENKELTMLITYIKIG